MGRASWQPIWTLNRSVNFSGKKWHSPPHIYNDNWKEIIEYTYHWTDYFHIHFPQSHSYGKCHKTILRSATSTKLYTTNDKNFRFFPHGPQLTSVHLFHSLQRVISRFHVRKIFLIKVDAVLLKQEDCTRCLKSNNDRETVLSGLATQGIMRKEIWNKELCVNCCNFALKLSAISFVPEQMYVYISFIRGVIF